MPSPGLSLAELLAIEKRHSAFGLYPDVSVPGGAVYVAQIRDHDAKRAQALVLSEDDYEIPTLLKIRTWIARGSLREALAMIRRALPAATERSERSELLLEKARALGYRGNWKESLNVIDESFALGPTPVSQLTLFQMKAHALYEAGQMTRALESLEQAETLGRIFPHSISRVYALALRIKIQARDRGPEHAQALLQKSWKELFELGPLDADAVLTFLRVQLDIDRLQGHDVLALALSTYLIAEHMGDQQYMALAILDAYVSAAKEAKRVLQAEFLRACESFERVKALAYEALAKTPIRSVTGASLKAPSSLPDGDAHLALLESAQGASHIVLSRGGFVIGLSPWRVECMSASPQLHAAVRTLTGKRVQKLEFFHALWKHWKYTPRIHDPLIWNLIYRLRKEVGLRPTMGPSGISLRGTLLIDGAP